MMEHSAFLLIVAGPNGAGKSTFTKAGKNALPVIDPDQIARIMNPENIESVAIAAGKEALRRARDFITARQSFAQETTLAGTSTLRLMAQAKEAGFRVHLVYVGLDAPERSRIRIAERVTKGGHNIPLDDLMRRYHRSLQNLPKALALADRAYLFDNSSHTRPPRRIMAAEAGTLIHHDAEFPSWAVKLAEQARHS